MTERVVCMRGFVPQGPKLASARWPLFNVLRPCICFEAALSCIEANVAVWRIVFPMPCGMTQTPKRRALWPK